jgi:hypothetical protein
MAYLGLWVDPAITFDSIEHWPCFDESNDLRRESVALLTDMVVLLQFENSESPVSICMCSSLNSLLNNERVDPEGLLNLRLL